MCHRRFFLFKRSFELVSDRATRNFVSLFPVLHGVVCAVGANRDVLLKTFTKFPAGGVPNDVKGKTVVMKFPASSVQN